VYKIKPNGKYVLLIKDLGLTLSHENIDGALIDDEKFENSNDVKKLLRYLSVEKLDGDAKIESEKRIEKVIEDEKKDTVFVSHEETSKEPKDMFVRNNEEVPAIKLEEPKIIPAVEPKEVKVEVIENNKVDTTDVENIANENITDEINIENKVENTIIENVETKVKDSFSNIEAEVKKINKNNKKKNSK
jgi:hypothetical protein